MRLVLVTAILAALGACHAAPNGICPTLIEYDATFNRRLADDVESLPADGAAYRAIRDYIVLRDQVRACRDLG